jgi:hypothetical protein
MNMKSTNGSAVIGTNANQPAKKIANAGEAFEKYKMKLQEKNERVSYLFVKYYRNFSLKFIFI